MEISVEDAYDIACHALGEAMVRERIYKNHAAKLQQQIVELQGQEVVSEATEVVGEATVTKEPDDKDNVKGRLQSDNGLHQSKS